jgi:hypothetical protein
MARLPVRRFNATNPLPFHERAMGHGPVLPAVAPGEQDWKETAFRTLRCRGFHVFDFGRSGCAQAL